MPLREEMGAAAFQSGGGKSGDQDVIALVSNRNAGGLVYEMLDDDLNTVATLGVEAYMAQTA